MHCFALLFSSSYPGPGVAPVLDESYAGFPPSIALGAFDFLKPGRLNAPLLNQFQRFLPVDLRPDALAERGVNR
jgi:hypothetical protein